jgi:hypothetical protein
LGDCQELTGNKTCVNSVSFFDKIVALRLFVRQKIKEKREKIFASPEVSVRFFLENLYVPPGACTAAKPMGFWEACRVLRFAIGLFIFQKISKN